MSSSLSLFRYTTTINKYAHLPKTLLSGSSGGISSINQQAPSFYNNNSSSNNNNKKDYLYRQQQSQQQQPQPQQYITPLNSATQRLFHTTSSLNQSTKLMSAMASLADKIKKGSFMLDEHNVDRSFNSHNYEVKLLDPLGLLNPSPDTKTRNSADIFKMVDSDLQKLTNNIVEHIKNHLSGNSSIGSGLQKPHPILVSISSYYFQLKGKRIRPTIILLLSRCLLQQKNITEPIASQIKLAEIVEMIHTATLVHDDVIDEATTRRDVPSVNKSFSNKLSILCGDYLLARASVLLSQLRNPDVSELISTSLADLVEGEFMQVKSNESSFEQYLRKTYLKTASLISNSCKATALLGGEDAHTANLAFEFGKNLGLAFQLIDDLLDYTSTTEVLGKQAFADLAQGLATAPVLYASIEHPQLLDMISRKFSADGDVEEARSLVFKSRGIEMTRALATEYINKAIEILIQFPKSEARDVLILLCHTIVTRKF
ncbi:trans-prenyltransferase [Cavenderia fasciculata]|uniref:Trans-prenyltransferase n=1 Tax=Cavenderia fasciculata TaxID=261658 RepID=F4PIG3_CACFS|nr:trans-prenyltransferase [Cavenderia fasciculata]EGG25392.1 trans-prenyltransferase [Cavenderia fasciculata]|eukprot:XP_004363243.1 trans-prenyltransferase [Cavenderia fasciculata]